MSITEDAPVRQAPRRSPVRLPGPARRATPWWWLVVASAFTLAGVAAVMGVWWAASSESRTPVYRVVGTLSAIELDLGDASVEIVGGATGAIEVQRTEEFAFGQPPRTSRSERNGVFRVVSRCPDTIVGTCKVSYRISVRDNVQVNVRTTSGRVRIAGLNGSARIETGSGAISVEGFCGFQLTATSASGDVGGAADCSPDRVELRSGSGDVHAVVPTGRYRVDASSDGGSARIRNLVASDDASYAVQAISGTGDVLVEGRR
jgi:hypothetical protein